jgi:hypothetical protein
VVESVSGNLWDAVHGISNTSTSATDINEAGQVVGRGDGGVSLWTPDSPNGVTGDFINLGTPPGFSDY